MTIRELIDKLKKLEKLSSPDTEIFYSPYLSRDIDIYDVWITENEDKTITAHLSDYAGEEIFGKRTYV